MTLLCEIRGWRNNNPGNLTDSRIEWDGETGEDLDPRFEEFTSPEYGLRAMARLLGNYQSLHGLDTIRAIVSRYAPAAENDTQAYIDRVCCFTGLEPDEPVRLDREDQLRELMKAMVTVELGIQPYSDALYDLSIGMARA